MAKTVREENLAFKQRATEALHARAEDQGWCATFDTILTSIGLPARARFDGAERGYWERDYGFKFELTDEDAEPTRKAFEAWRLDASSKLAAAVREYGLDVAGSYERLAELGFTTPERKDIVIEGTFTHTQTVYVIDGEDVIDKVDRRRLGRGVRDSIHYGEDAANTQVTWKAKVAN
jgi:hypothetical protein